MALNVKEKLRCHETTFGTWQMIGNTSISEILCGCNFEWVVIDMEHTGIDVDDALELIRVIELSGKVPAVRVSVNDFTLIKRVLDAGAKIIIVPMVMNKQDAEIAVSAVYYPPRGTRGVGLARAQGYGFSFENYKDSFENEAVVVAQIEHIEAIRNLEDIESVDGIDATIIGPYDLSGSLGHPGDFERIDFKEALEQYEMISRKTGKPMGYHMVQPTKENVGELVDKGYKFIALGFDTYFIGKQCRDMLQEVLGE